jgi:hypothetical protein
MPATGDATFSRLKGPNWSPARPIGPFFMRWRGGAHEGQVSAATIYAPFFVYSAWQPFDIIVAYGPAAHLRCTILRERAFLRYIFARSGQAFRSVS